MEECKHDHGTDTIYSASGKAGYVTADVVCKICGAVIASYEEKE